MAGEGAEPLEELEMRGGGVLRLRQEGPRVHMEAERPEDGRGLYKVWLHGDQGGKLLLGTLAPEGGRLRLRRTLSVGELERAGCWPQFRAAAVLSFSFQEREPGGWYCERKPDRLVSDPVLKGQLNCSMLCRRSGEGFSLAAPFRTNCPIPLTALFCLARVERRNGQPHLVWSFDREGIPRLPPQKGRE